MDSTIVSVSPFVPAEWIAAHGLRPSRIRVGSVPSGEAGVCPFADSFASEAEHRLAGGLARAAIVTSTCDQMRRGAETVGAGDAVFLMNVPHTWQTRIAHRIYIAELERLGRFLVALGGRSPSRGELAAVMRRFDDGRRALRESRGRMDDRAYVEALAEFHVRGDGAFEPPPEVAAARTGIPVGLVGGPLRADDLVLFDVIEAAGGRVALDATDTGDRALPAPFDRRRLAEDPLLEIADAYFGSIPAVFRRPNRLLYEFLSREIASSGVKALVAVCCVWCDLWHAEVARIRDWTDVPVTEITLADGDAGRRRIETRVQALLETAAEGSSGAGSGGSRLVR